MVARAAVLAAVLVAAGCGEDGPRREATAADEPRCGARPEPRDPATPPILQKHQLVELGCARTRAGRQVRLYAIPQAGGPCLVIAGLPGGPRACGRAPSERVPPVRAAIGGPAIVRRSPDGKLELYGETAATVRRVALRYRLPDGRRGHRDATLIRAEDPARLREARVRDPFGYFIGTVPARARRVSAVALDGSGAQRGRLGFDGIVRSMHPRVFLASEG